VKRALLPLCSLALAGCVQQSLALAAGERARPSSPAAVDLLEEVPARPHEAIGVVHAHCRTNWLAYPFNCSARSMRELLRIRAGELGADAVIDIRRTSFWQIEWTDIHLRGKAVRWTGDRPG
jgi:hypothetical protein